MKERVYVCTVTLTLRNSRDDDENVQRLVRDFERKTEELCADAAVVGYFVDVTSKEPT